ncbi:hypothetical protein [Clavibacter phaseoli]|uniref:hypothetical protein n=1 Tax=Clavibacter phaseoli TaxID=1734031 RepID=UPI0011C23A2A|nr:hypothetical protein [Clavibacter phaseoli]
MDGILARGGEQPRLRRRVVRPAQLAVSGLEVTWIADVPARAFDGSVRMAGGGLSVVWAPDGTLTLSSPDVLLAY